MVPLDEFFLFTMGGFWITKGESDLLWETDYDDCDVHFRSQTKLIYDEDRLAIRSIYSSIPLAI